MPVTNPDGSDPRTLQELWVALARARRSTYLGVDTNGRLTFGKPDEPVSNIGPSRAGKTTGIFVPAVACFPGPAIVASIRSDLRDDTLAARKLLAATHGGSVMELDFTGNLPVVSKRIYWDPLKGAESWNVAMKRADLFAELTITDHQSSHWGSRAADFLAPLMHAAALQGEDALGLMRSLQLDEETLARYKATLAESPSFHALSTFDGVMEHGRAAEEERSSIRSTAEQIFRCFKLDRPAGVDWATWWSNWDLDEFFTTPSTIYITVPMDEEKTLRPAIVAFIDLIYKGWEAAKLRLPNRQPSVMFALDEAAHISPVPYLPRYMTAGGGDGVVPVVGLQDTSQTVRSWGPTGVLLYRGVHRCIFPGLDDNTYLKEIVGNLPSKVQHDSAVEIRDADLGREEGVAGRHRLRSEREAVESRVRQFPGDEEGYQWEETCYDLAGKRIDDNLRIRRKYLIQADDDPVKALQAELEDLTYIKDRTDWRPDVKVSDIVSPPDGHVYRKSGEETTLTRVEPWFDHPRLGPMLQHARETVRERERTGQLMSGPTTPLPHPEGGLWNRGHDPGGDIGLTGL